MNRTKHILLVTALTIMSAIVVVLNIQQERIYHITSNAILSPSTYQSAPNANVLSILDGKQEIKPYKSNNSHAGQANVESFNITNSMSSASSGLFASKTSEQSVASNGNSRINSNRSARTSNYNSATTSTLGVSAMAYGSKRSNGGNGSDRSGLVSFRGSFLGSSIFSDNSTSFSADNTTLGSADPGGDPTGEAIPVPDGLFFLLALALVYLVWKMDLVKKIRTSLK